MRVLISDSIRNGKKIFRLENIEEEFARWYVPKGDPVYIERALKALASESFIKILDSKTFEALS